MSGHNVPSERGPVKDAVIQGWEDGSVSKVPVHKHEVMSLDP